MRLLVLILCFIGLQNAVAVESDPASYVENVSTIFGDYTEVEVDAVVAAPDPLVLFRFYSSRETGSLGGWRFNPHCFLTRDSSDVFVGTSEGSILTYSSRDGLSFRLDVAKNPGLANTARGEISAWTNLKNNELCFDPQKNSFELNLCTGGKRLYVKHHLLDLYLLKLETLPTGNKILYEFDDQNRLVLVKETNASQGKILGWIKIQYADTVHVDTSDGKMVDYHFDDGFLVKVIRSDKPTVRYRYDQGLLAKEEWPEGRFVCIDYEENKVRSLSTPTGERHFSYGLEEDGSHWTEVIGPLNRKTIYRSDKNLQLTHVEHYLKGNLYRVYKNVWGKRKNASNLIATSIEDQKGCVFYSKSYVYDDENRGNLVEVHEQGNITGANLGSLNLDNTDESYDLTYVYSDEDDFDVVESDGIRCFYKKGTNILLKKAVLDNKVIKKRWLYEYNENESLIRIIVDNHDDLDFEFFSNATVRHITEIVPKNELPNIGTPEVIEEKYVDMNDKKVVLLKKTVNHFDVFGNITRQDSFDANGDHRYSIKREYKDGLLVLETDPMGNEIRYFYDRNQNLIKEQRLTTSLEYTYDLENRLVSTVEKDNAGNCFEVRCSYDAAGNKISETDRFGYETTYIYDDLDRIQSVTHPENQKYTYSYDLFDNPIIINDFKGNSTQKTYNIWGRPDFDRLSGWHPRTFQI